MYYGPVRGVLAIQRAELGTGSVALYQVRTRGGERRPRHHMYKQYRTTVQYAQYSQPGYVEATAWDTIARFVQGRGDFPPATRTRNTLLRLSTLRAIKSVDIRTYSTVLALSA